MKIIIFLYTHFSFDQSIIINIITQTKTGGKITLFTDRKPRTVDVYYARTLDGKRYIKTAKGRIKRLKVDIYSKRYIKRAKAI